MTGWNGSHTTPSHTYPEATPDQLSMTLMWELAEPSSLRGLLVATNISGHVVTLTGKPGLQPLTTDGQRMDSRHIITLEGRIPDRIEVEIGERALARVTWSSWDGTPTKGDLEVLWPGGSMIIHPSGPTHPAKTESMTMTSSYWWETESAFVAQEDLARMRPKSAFYLDRNGVRRERSPDPDAGA